ncbi:helix-turn-helix domain-containing protein [Patescibacteria group bacterium]|nr:helix-turn-helix domain-containing protein [Patescibacteria group bacterium]
MRKDRHLAIKLRREGKSYNEIYKELGIPKSTLHLWFRNNGWSQEIKRNLIKKAQILARPQLKAMALANKNKWEKWHEKCRRDAIEEFSGLRENELFIVGLMLYWGEGDKVIKNGIVRLTNSDPEMIKIFYSFLDKVLSVPIEKIIIKLILYPDLKDTDYRKFWSKFLQVPLSQFRTSAVIVGKHPTKRLSFGMCSIEVYSRELKEKILTWLKLYQKCLTKKDTRML